VDRIVTAPIIRRLTNKLDRNQSELVYEIVKVVIVRLKLLNINIRSGRACNADEAEEKSPATVISRG